MRAGAMANDPGRGIFSDCIFLNWPGDESGGALLTAKKSAPETILLAILSCAGLEGLIALFWQKGTKNVIDAATQIWELWKS